MMLGQERFSAVNAPLGRLIEQRKCLIAVHRGSWGGNIIQNTIPAYDTSIKMGADMVETDVNSSTDGVLYSFHDGNEQRVLGVPENIKTMSSARIDSLLPINTTAARCSRRLNRLSEILEHFSDGTPINIDRAWDIFPQLLALLDQYEGALTQVVIKAPASQTDAIKVMNEHSVKYMFMPICYSLADVKNVLAFKDVNTVGIELIAKTDADELFSDESIRYIHDHHLFTWVNAITLDDTTPKPLYALLDDDISLLDNPDKGWGKLLEKKIDIIQTDWPAILRDYRARWIKEHS